MLSYSTGAGTDFVSRKWVIVAILRTIRTDMCIIACNILHKSLWLPLHYSCSNFSEISLPEVYVVQCNTRHNHVPDFYVKKLKVAFVYGNASCFQDGARTNPRRGPSAAAESSRSRRLVTCFPLLWNTLHFLAAFCSFRQAAAQVYASAIPEAARIPTNERNIPLFFPKIRKQLCQVLHWTTETQKCDLSAKFEHEQHRFKRKILFQKF